MSVIQTIAKRKKFITQWKLQIEESTLFTLTSALNIIMNCSDDSAHLKFSDLSKQLHHLLIDVMLTIADAKKYAQIL